MLLTGLGWGLQGMAVESYSLRYLNNILNKSGRQKSRAGRIGV